VPAVLAFAPLLQGVILKVEERVQRAQGPSIWQPYRDLRKLFAKEVMSSSWLHLLKVRSRRQTRGGSADGAPHSEAGSITPADTGLPFAASVAPRGDAGN
jgi:hypothetical protein